MEEGEALPTAATKKKMVSFFSSSRRSLGSCSYGVGPSTWQETSLTHSPARSFSCFERRKRKKKKDKEEFRLFLIFFFSSLRFLYFSFGEEQQKRQ
jgi:hypothetical protein